MKDIEFLGAGLRIAGILCIIFAIGKAGDAINTLHQFTSINTGIDEQIFKLVVLTPIFIITICGFVLIRFPITLAKMLLPKSSTDTASIDFSENALSISGFTLLGAYLLTVAIPDFAYNALFLYHQYSLGLDQNVEITQTFIYMVFTTIQLGLGLYLLVGAKGLYKTIRRIRN